MGLLGKPCKEPRCPNIVTGAGRYCQQHAGQDIPWDGARRQRLRLYGSARWQRLRKIKLAKNPMCEICNRQLAVQVHHLLKARDNPEQQFNMSNLQSVCLLCHARETQKETRETIKRAKYGN